MVEMSVAQAALYMFKEINCLYTSQNSGKTHTDVGSFCSCNRGSYDCPHLVSQRNKVFRVCILRFLHFDEVKLNRYNIYWSLGLSTVL